MEMFLKIGNGILAISFIVVILMSKETNKQKMSSYIHNGINGGFFTLLAFIGDNVVRAIIGLVILSTSIVMYNMTAKEESMKAKSNNLKK